MLVVLNLPDLDMIMFFDLDWTYQVRAKSKLCHCLFEKTDVSSGSLFSPRMRLVRCCMFILY
jgi:hypothetical protein